MANIHSSKALHDRLSDLYASAEICGNTVFHVAIDCDAGIYHRSSLWLAVTQLQNIKEQITSLSEEFGSEAAE